MFRWRQGRDALQWRDLREGSRFHTVDPRPRQRDIDAVVTVTDLSVKFGQSFFISKQSGGAKVHPLLEPLCVDGGHYSLHEGASVGAS